MDSRETLDIYDRVTDFFVKEKLSVSEVQGILVAEGMNDMEAQMIINEISDRMKTLKIQRANNNIMDGFVLMIIGFLMSTNKNLIWIGIIIVIGGLYKIIKGFIRKSSSRSA